MSQEDSFLQAILDNPEDDTCRLVYADWLDDHGDHDRAEFIRVQIELDHLGPAQDEESRAPFIEPNTRGCSYRVECMTAQCAAERAALRHSRYPELKRREEELLDAHSERWAKPVCDYVLGLRFRRGFVERVDITPTAFVEHGATLFRMAPIVHLNLRGQFKEEEPIPDALALPHLDRLTALGISAISTPGEVVVRALANARQLSRLSWLAVTADLDDADAEVLANLPHLSSLTDLHLEENNLEAAGVAALASSPHLQRLTSLYLAFNRLGNTGVTALLTSPLLDRLLTLDLYGNILEDSAELVDLLGSPRLSGLNTLYLGHNFNLPSGVQALLQSPHLRQLTTLDLIEVEMNFDHARALANSPGLVNLTTLNLGANFGDGCDEVMKVLAESPSLHHLLAFRSSSNYIGNSGAKALASSPHLSNLAWLHLGYNEIGPGGGLALAKSTTLKSLTHLDLDLNPIGLKAVKALRRRFGDAVSLYECESRKNR